MTCRGRTPKANTCGGNGWCRSLRELALRRKNGNVTFVNTENPSQAVYGVKSWDASTWDADSIHGCIGDDYGYYPDSQSPYHNITSAAFWNQGRPEEGNDIRNNGNMQCPFGLDIREYEIYLKNGSYDYIDDTQFNANHTFARQRVYCTANAGSFRLNFRNESTNDIAYDASPQTLMAALESLTSIGKVDVTLNPSSTETSTVCSSDASDNHYFQVWFVTERGPLPLMLIDDNSLSHGTAVVLDVDHRVSGAGTMKECSGKGECNRATGICECWPYWGSSDGYGNIGIRNDCGYSLIA